MHVRLPFGGVAWGAFAPWNFLAGTKFVGMRFWGFSIGQWHFGVVRRSDIDPHPARRQMNC